MESNIAPNSSFLFTGFFLKRLPPGEDLSAWRIAKCIFSLLSKVSITLFVAVRLAKSVIQIISFRCDEPTNVYKRKRFPPTPILITTNSNIMNYNILPEDTYNFLINLEVDTSNGVDPFDLINDTDKDLVLYLLYCI